MVEGYAPLRSYDSKLRHAVNEMSRKVLGRPLDNNLRTPGKYTGELCINCCFVLDMFYVYMYVLYCRIQDCLCISMHLY